MNKQFVRSTLFVGIFAFIVLFIPHKSFAFSADLVSITPEPQQDITDMVSGAPEGVVLFGWFNTAGTEYTAVFNVDESPAVVITAGGDIPSDSPWTYNADDGTLTVTFTASGMKQTGDGPTEDTTILALVPAVDDPETEDGPPVEMTGAWLSTDVQDWELIPPSQDNVAFGFSLTGPEGETGFFHMFMPDSMVDFLSEMSGKELTMNDLAVFNGDNQSSMSITPIDGGAIIDINVKFLSSAISATAEDESGGITKEITVREQLPVSLATNKTALKKGKQAKLFGWLKSGKKDKQVEIWRKQSDESEFTQWKTLKTGKNGKFLKTFIARKTATYKVKYYSGDDTIVSPTQKITVNN